MKLTYTLAAFAATALAANAAISISTPANNNVIGGGGFSLNFSSSGLTTDYTAPDSAPLDPTISLTSFDFVAGGTGGSYSGGTRYLAVFDSTSFSVGSYVGVSNEALELSDSGAQSYSFDSLEVSTTSTNAYYFTTWIDAGGMDGQIQFSELTQEDGRMRMLTGNPLDDGAILNGNGTVSNADWDPAGTFNATSAVPEPSSAALLGLGGLALILRRRK